MSRLAGMIKAICEVAGDRVNDYVYNEISQWWQDIREILLECPKSFGLLAAIVCKSVAAKLRRGYREVHQIVFRHLQYNNFRFLFNILGLL